MYSPEETEDCVRNKLAKTEYDSSTRNVLTNPANVEQFIEEKSETCYVSNKCVALPMLNTPTTSQAEKVMFDYLKCVGRTSTEDMYVVHSYQHVGNRGVSMTSGEANVHDKKVDEIDFVVIHKQFGCMLFEIKLMAPSHFSTKDMKRGKKPVSHAKMIREGDEQLAKRWKQIREYLIEFLSLPTVWDVWSKYFDIEKPRFDDIDSVVDAITVDTKNRSFLCLFEYKHSLDGGDCKKFDCHSDCSVCHGSYVVSHATVLAHSELNNKDSFFNWWITYFGNHYKTHGHVASFAHLLLINRFVMDHMLSMFHINDRNIDNAAILMDKNVQSILNMSVDQKQKPLLPSLEQLKLCVNGPNELRIQGPAGTGKTIVLIQKVKNLISEIFDESFFVPPEKVHPTIILVLCYKEPLRLYILKHLEAEISRLRLALDILTVDDFLNHFFRWFRKRPPGPNEYAQFTDEHLGDEFESKVRIPHIFIDESHNISSDLILFLYSKVFINSNNNGHFWMLYDPCQNIKFNDMPLPLPHFPTFYLNQVYRCSQEQFSFSKRFLNNIKCDHCAECRQKETSSVKKICRQCTPICCVNVSGPNPIGIICNESWLYSELPSSSDIHASYDNYISLIAFALLKAWKNYVPELLEETISERDIFTILKARGRIKQTVVLVANYSFALRVRFATYKKYGVTKRVPYTPEFELISNKEAVIIDSYENFQGRDAPVVIVLDDPCKNVDSIVFTRATCLTVVIAKRERLEFLDIMGSEEFRVIG